MTLSVSNEPASSIAGSDPRRRGPWLVAGAALWLIVGVAAIVLLRNRSREADLPVARPAEPDLRPIAESALQEGSQASNTRIARPVEASSLERWDPRGVGDFQFTERNGRTVTKADLLGKPWVICFVFTRCYGPCREVSGQMSKLQEALRDTEVRLVTLTVDPDYDTQDILRREADAFGADPERWLFLTGEKAKIFGLIRDSFRMPVKETTGAERVPGFEVIHSTNLMLVDEYGVVQEKYNGLVREDVERLVKRLKGPAVAELPQTSAETRP